MANGKILDITNDVKWIGITDPGLRIFDIIMETKYGTTYNSYFINADKPAIIDTSKEKFAEEYINKVKAVINPEKIQYIILNHTEPDHSGALKDLLKIAPNATVVASGNAIRFLKDIMGIDFKSFQIKDGDKLSLGNKNLKFIGAPNLHWPDTVFTYLQEDKLLFSCDAFGSHFCDERMFDDEVPDFDEAFTYYFNTILKPFSKFMLQAVDKISNLEIHAVCPGHGPILRKYWRKYIDLSAEYARRYISKIKPDRHCVFIPFVSAYGYTAEMAEKIAEGIKQAGNIEVILQDIQASTFEILSDSISSATAIIIGSPTINQNILPQIYLLFSAINPIRDKGKLAAAFGSYGWSGEGVNIIETILETLTLKVVCYGIKIKFSPHKENYKALTDFGKNFALQLVKKN